MGFHLVLSTQSCTPSVGGQLAQWFIGRHLLAGMGSDTQNFFDLDDVTSGSVTPFKRPVLFDNATAKADTIKKI